MAARIPLPDELRGRGFTRDEAARAGSSQGRLRRKDIVRPFHGVQATAEAETTIGRCRDYSAKLKPGQFFTHETAARLHGLTLPTGIPETELHVGALRPADAPHSRGIRGHRLQFAGEPWQVCGLPVPDPIEVFCQLGSELGAEDLTVIADELMNRAGDDEERLRLAMLDRIRRARRVGASKLERAAHAARIGSRSPAETRVRIVLESAGLPRAELNAPIHHSSTGVYLGSPDFVWRDRRVVLEYEGERHRLDQGQFRYDIVRYDDLASDGWRVLRATGDDLGKEGRKRLVQRVGRALGR
jgi:hypothetical protein